MKKVLIGLIIVIILLLLYGFYLNPMGFKIVESVIEIKNLPNSFDGFKIVQISDLLLGSTKFSEDLEKIVDSINKINPDIVVFNGDLISNGYTLSEEELSKTKDCLKNIEVNMYKYAVMGDNDKNNIDVFQEVMLASDFEILDNESTYLFYKDETPIKITGISDNSDINKALEISDNLEVAFNLVLTHYPDYVDYFGKENVDVVMAGHSLKGQIRIPFIGGILHKDGANKYLDSYFEVNDIKLYVSGGLGTEKIQFRLFNKPEINLYRLKKS